jgi:multiple sugar transport system permease protein
MLGVSAFFLLPLTFLMATSLTQGSNVFSFPPKLFPDPVEWSNYIVIWERYPLLRWFGNSFFITITIVIGQIFTSSLAGFAFAKLKFPGRDKLFFIYLIGLLVPSQVLLIPIFVLVSNLGWVNTPWGLIIPALAGPFGTFLYRQFYLSVSDEYIAAARLDGASLFRIWWSIFLPLSRGLTATFAVLIFLITWNSYLWPLVLLRSVDNFTVTLGLASIAGAPSFAVPWEIVMATSITILLPILGLFVFAQRQLVQGVALSGYSSK